MQTKSANAQNYKALLRKASVLGISSMLAVSSITAQDKQISVDRMYNDPIQNALAFSTIASPRQQIDNDITAKRTNDAVEATATEHKPINKKKLLIKAGFVALYGVASYFIVKEGESSNSATPTISPYKLLSGTSTGTATSVTAGNSSAAASSSSSASSSASSGHGSASSGGHAH